MSGDLTLVPPNRLGTLLTHQRTLRGLTIDELLNASALGFSSEELRGIEQGKLLLSDDQVNRLMVAYGAGSGPVIPERSELIIDLHHGAVFAGTWTKVLPAEATIDDVLGRYLSLLYLMRGMAPGAELVLRGEDVEILSRALERSITEVEGRLFELMLPGEVAPWFGRVRHRLAVPAAGILVGLTAVGSLVLVQFPDGERPQTTGVGDASATVISQPIAVTEAATEPLTAEVIGATSTERTGGAEVGTAVSVIRPGDAGALAYEVGVPDSVGAVAEVLLGFEFRSVLPEWTVEYAGPREGYRGSTNTVTRTISVYVSVEDAPSEVAEVLGHELGHAFDVMYLDATGRQAWLDERGIDTPWWPDGEVGDFGVGAGDFAEAVAAVVVGSPSDSENGPFSESDLELVRSLLPEVGLPGQPVQAE